MTPPTTEEMGAKNSNMGQKEYNAYLVVTRAYQILSLLALDTPDVRGSALDLADDLVMRSHQGLRYELERINRGQNKQE